MTGGDSFYRHPLPILFRHPVETLFFAGWTVVDWWIGLVEAAEGDEFLPRLHFKVNVGSFRGCFDIGGGGYRAD